MAAFNTSLDSCECCQSLGVSGYRIRKLPRSWRRLFNKETFWVKNTQSHDYFFALILRFRSFFFKCFIDECRFVIKNFCLHCVLHSVKFQWNLYWIFIIIRLNIINKLCTRILLRSVRHLFAWYCIANACLLCSGSK